MTLRTNSLFSHIHASWLPIAAWTLVFFIVPFIYLSVQKQRYEMTIIVPSALEAYSFDSSSLTELMRQYSSADFSGGILSDLKKQYGEKWDTVSSIRKNDLVILQRGNISIIHARATDPIMARQLGETMAAFIQSTKGTKISQMKEKSAEYNNLSKRLRADLTASDALQKEAVRTHNLLQMIAFYDARQLNYGNILSVEQTLLQADKYIQMNDFLENAKKAKPHPIDNHRILNSLLFGFLGMLISTTFSLSKSQITKQ